MIEEKGFMPDPSGRDRFPGSRDWDLQILGFKCDMEDCVANYNKKCTMPTLVSINNKGKCKGYKKRKHKK